MAFRTSLVSINTSTPTRVLLAVAGDVDCEIRTTGALDFYIGGPDASTSSLLVQNGEFRTRVRPGDELWAISAESSGFGVRVLVRSA